MSNGPDARGLASVLLGRPEPQERLDGGSVRFEDGSSDPTIEFGPTRRTVVPRRAHVGLPPPVRRRTRQVTSSDVYNLLGALLVSLCTTYLLFGVLASFSGLIGFVIVFYVIFLVAYAVLVSINERGPTVRDKIMTSVLYSTAMLALGALSWVILSTVWRGHRPLGHLNFYTQDLSTTGNFAPRSKGGAAHALVGTLWQVGIALVLTVPLGITCAVFLSEVGGPVARLVRTVVEAMTALPSIVAGLFIYITWIVTLHEGHSGLAAALAISVTMLPIMIRAADVVLRLVPGNLREASCALGAPTWRTVWHVILPTARSGLTTSVILAVAWGIGETAPVLLTAGYTTYMNTNPLRGPMVSLPLAAYELVKTGIKTMVERGFAVAAFLLLVVIVLFAIARIVGGRGPGQLSKMQRRRAVRASRRDAQRFAVADGGRA